MLIPPFIPHPITSLKENDNRNQLGLSPHFSQASRHNKILEMAKKLALHDLRASSPFSLESSHFSVPHHQFMVPIDLLLGFYCWCLLRAAYQPIWTLLGPM